MLYISHWKTLKLTTNVVRHWATNLFCKCTETNVLWIWILSYLFFVANTFAAFDCDRSGCKKFRIDIIYSPVIFIVLPCVLRVCTSHTRDSCKFCRFATQHHEIIIDSRSSGNYKKTHIRARTYGKENTKGRNSLQRKTATLICELLSH